MNIHVISSDGGALVVDKHSQITVKPMAGQGDVVATLPAVLPSLPKAATLADVTKALVALGFVTQSSK